MASITRRVCKDGTDSYRVLIRRKSVYLCKTFKSLKIAKLWMIKNEPRDSND
jgi:hypothetical protein